MNAVMLPVTLVAAGGAAIINFWLALRVGAMRRESKVSIGDGGHDKLIARMRAQANFVEYAPFILILIGLIEFTAGTSTWLWIASALFLLGRIGHAFGMDGMRYGRSIGIAITLLLLLGLAVYAVMLPFTVVGTPHPTNMELAAPRG